MPRPGALVRRGRRAELAISASGSPAGAKDMPTVVSRHGPAAPAARLGHEPVPGQLAQVERAGGRVSPIRSPASVAVIAPPSSSASTSAIRTGWASARSVRVSVIVRSP